jgi:hypothetical protein
VLETYNAESNPYMLAINVDMGYRPHRAFATYQGDLAGARASLGEAVGAQVAASTTTRPSTTRSRAR